MPPSPIVRCTGWGRRLPRQGPAGRGHHLDDPAAGQRVPVRLGPAPDRQTRARPRLKGAKLGKLKDLATAATWTRTSVPTGTDGPRPWTWPSSRPSGTGRSPTPPDTPSCCIEQAGSTNAYDLALFTTDTTAPPEQVVERYAVRWSIEPSNAAGKQQMGVGQARNRLPKAVERTVPFGMIIQSMVIAWYALYGYDPADVTDRAIAQPWYRTKTEPSFEDMITKLRKTLIATRFTPVTTGQPDPDLLHDYALACAAAAA